MNVGFAALGQECEQLGLRMPSDIQTTHDRDLARLRERLGAEAFSEAWAEGRALSFEQTVVYALAVAASARPTTASSPPVQPPTDPELARLTPRERVVAVLVARGRTNREIAEALVLSERTVDTHVHNMLGKLEITSRAQIAAWAVEHGLGRGP